MKTNLGVNRGNVGRIAEGIIANELEARGFRVSHLNRDGVSANADLIAAGHKKVWQIQVKGATNQSNRWWVQYGYCTPEIIKGTKKNAPMFNRRQSFYSADFVTLVAVRSPKDYRCVVLRAKDAEKAAQIHLDRTYRISNRDGTEKKPGKVWMTLEPRPREHEKRKAERNSIRAERRILARGQGEKAWNTLHGTP